MCRIRTLIGKGRIGSVFEGPPFLISKLSVDFVCRRSQWGSGTVSSLFRWSLFNDKRTGLLPSCPSTFNYS